MPNTPPLSEFALIDAYFRPLTRGRPEALGLLDDAALLAPASGEQLVVTTDALVEGRHFLPDTNSQALGHKALAVNLSDLAAMAARPLAYTLALSLPDGAPHPEWLDGFSRGLGGLQDEVDVFLAGGDTVATPGPLSIVITAFGSLPNDRALTRNGASSGDDVYVSGTIGDGALGLLVARDQRAFAGPAGDLFLTDRYLRPTPRNALGQALAGVASACADVSDGLVADLGHICRASGLGATVDAGLVPLSGPAAEAIATDETLLTTAVTGGDDYELVFTAAAVRRAEIEALAQSADIPLTLIGAMSTEKGVRMRLPGGGELVANSGGYRHF